MEDPGAARAVTVAVAVVAALVGLALVSLGPGGDDRSPAAALALAAPPTTTPTTTPTTPPATTAPTTRAPTTTAVPTSAPTTATTAPASTSVDPGTLPQTDQLPPATSAPLAARAQGLWDAIVQDQPALALPFFFPKGAYLQVKAISDPSGDYDHRLIADYEQDIHAYHAQLGASAAAAHFDGLEVPSGQAVWVQPGAEYNKGSYWRVYGTTLRYTLGGASATLPVASMISWRGEWYVVHLGSIR